MTAEEKATVYLLDVSFFTFRAYHALPPLNTSSGLATNAVHGVESMLERLIRIEEPLYLAACFDSPGPSFRNDVYPAYKANRAEPDEDLRVQFPYIRRLIEAMAISCIEHPRYEADDLLATLAARFADQGHRVVIVTGDKDLMQCVGERVELYDPMRDRQVGPAEVVEKFGVGPRAVTDVQGLMGDSTDNIPGVRGIGPKTAAALIGHFGSLESTLERSDEIAGLKLRGAASVRKKVEEGRDEALLSKDLATVRTDAPLDVNLADLVFESPHTPELLALAEELEMERLARKLRPLIADADEPEPASCPPASRASLDGDWKALAGSELCFVLAEDENDEPLLALSSGARKALLRGAREFGQATASLAESGAAFCGFDLKQLCRLARLDPVPPGLDLGVASYLYDPSVGDHGRSAVVKRFLTEVAADTAGGSAEAMAVALDQVGRLLPLLRAGLVERQQSELYQSLEHPLVGVLAQMESCGVLLDTQMLGGLADEFDGRMKALVSRIYEAAGCEFNILSPVQLREILFERLGLPSKGIKKTKSGLSTDSDSLQALSSKHPLPALVLEYRGLAKLKSTYLDALPRAADGKGRIHTSLNQTVTATGRLSSSDPNLQNIPIRTDDGAKIRQAFVAPRGHVLLSADYNQIELRVLAHLSRDEALIAAFRQGLDIHAATASELFGVSLAEVTPAMRRTSKVINYGIVYGMGATRMSRELGIPRSEASDYIERYFARYAGVRLFYAQMLAGARRQGYVATLLGRRRYLPDIESENGRKRQAAERVATNTPIQGSAADIIKLAMVRLDARLRGRGPAARMVLQIHDELLLETPKEEAAQVANDVRSAMEGAASLAVPILVDIGQGRNWAEAHAVG